MMKADRDDVVQVLGERMRAERDGLDAEVKAEEIVAFHHGELAPDSVRGEAVRDLLAADPDLARTLLDLRDPEALKALEKESDAGESEIDAGWRDLMSRMGADEREPQIAETEDGVVGEIRPFPVKEAAVPRREPRRRVQLWALAAAFVMGCAAMLLASLFLPDLAGRGDRLPEVRLVQLEPLRPDAGPTRGVEEVTAHGAESSDLVVFQLWPPATLERSGDLPAVALARLEREDKASPALDSQAAVLQDGVYVVRLRADQLATGTYDVKLVDADGDEVARYQLIWE